MDIKEFGDKAVLIDSVGADNLSNLSNWLSLTFNSEPYEVRRGLDSILVESKVPTFALIDQVHAATAWFSRENKEAKGVMPSNLVRIPVTYDGEDLESLAKTLSITPRELIEAHTSIKWRVALVGFAPGFPYLVPSDSTVENIFARAPRLQTPRQSVPAGSVAVAASMSAIYPSNMPGGWNLLGHTDLVLFDASLDNPSLLSIDDLVEFVEE